MKPKKHLGFNGMRTMLSSCFNQIPEHRQSNKITYSAHDALMSGFACMHFQDPSLLQFQKRLEKKHHKSNLQTLFDIKSIPESTQLRTIIDGVDSDYFGSFFDDYTHYLQRGKHLAQYKLLDGLYYIPMDATDYFSSYACFCDRCLRTKSKKKLARDLSVEPTAVEMEELYSGEEDSGVRYSHKALQIAIMHPDMKQVIPLMPEEIRNTDGATKQDCEMNAGKRLIPKLRKAHPQLGIILGGDDLFSRQPIIEDTLAARMHYLFVAKPESHVYLMDWLNAYPQLNQYETIDPKKLNVRYVYQWMNNVPLHGGEKAIQVNYLDVKVYSTGKNGKEKRSYHNSWVTDIEITHKNAAILARGGRCRWKLENECFNTLKNQGYAIDHSYGHGDKNLCFNFYLLTLIAFSFHQVYELTDKVYQACRQHFGSKKHLWENVRANLRTFIFVGWDYLLAFTLDPEKYITGELPAPS
ncbi:MAG: hypothetical protein HY939_04320 [Gammaproteobacteria bacterium]|nr:hypothetical protein [Gammaproteobacteria bacterium]